jgi:hypothetical protein
MLWHPHVVVDLQQAGTRMQPEHCEAAHVQTPPLHGTLLLQVCGEPHPPQLFLSVSKLTQAPLQALKPASHVNVHALPTHAAVALGTVVEHACPHVPQLRASLVVATHPPLQMVGALAGHPDTQEYEPVAPAQTGAPPSGLHAAPQLPQLAAVESCRQAPLQKEKPLLHAKAHAPFWHTGVAFKMLVAHAFVQLPQ